ncbi:MAG: GAF domain-containing sensor histidine kinase, partial [Anaerolineales bacterium]|nr:GAF domain-containing sensor histidine kinase [Anaerolineales bacterium]
IDILQNVVDQAADTLDKIRLLNSTQQHIQELEALFNLSTSLREAYTLEEIAQTVVHHAYTAVGAAGTNLWLQQGDNTLVMKACLPRHPMAVGTQIPNTVGLVGQVFQKSQPIVSESLPNLAQAYPAIIERRLMSNAEASIVVPIITAEATIGVLNVWLNEFHRELALETRLLTAVGELAANAFERADLLASLERRVAIRTKELEEANESLKELDKLKSRFVSEVTHELRTPTANLRLYLDLFNRTNNPQKQARYVDVLNKQTTRLEHLVENILYLSRLDMSKESLNFTALKLQDVVEQVLVAMAEQAEEASLSLTFESKPIPLILGEENQLAQMITNLVDNAISYNEPNGTVQIRLFSSSADTVRLEIQDSGRGIAYEDWDHIFSRFYRGQNATQSNIPGRGLGLAIVKEIVDLHHGRVEMESAPGAGTTFCVEFPAINLKQTLPH